MKKIVLLTIVLAGVALAQNTGAFSGVDASVDALDASAKTTISTGVKHLIGWLPLVTFCVGVFGGLKYAKNKADQDQDSSKIWISAILGSVLGATVGVAIIALVSSALTGSAEQGIETLRVYWTAMFK